MQSQLFVVPLLVAILLSACAEPANVVSADPWALPPPPPTSVYSGPLFTLSHDYPANPVAPPDPAPWLTAIGGGEINTSNAAAYVQALKDYIAADMQVLLFDYENWDPGAAGWYNQPWLTQLDGKLTKGLREPIHGTYVGSPFRAAMFPQSGLQTDMTTHVLVYYDAVAAGSLQKVWGSDGMDPRPGLEAGGAQIPEGGIIVKPAFTTAGGNDWPPMEGAFPWKIWSLPGDRSSGSDPTLQDVYLFQFDIIVKDSVAAPKTGWVFSTLVYDKSVDSDNPWDKMVTLGAMWGNDPDVISPEDCDYLTPDSCPPLSENWINQDTPLYARETLGWGGRLSGPNDGAVDISAYIDSADGPLPYEGRYAMSSCMSCHSPAEFEAQSFLLPVPSDCTRNDVCQPKLFVDPQKDMHVVYYEAGSPEFMRWFQSRPGTEPMDSNTIALDYDMNYAFKVLPQWYINTGQTDKGKLNFIEGFNDYRGLPTK